MADILAPAPWTTDPECEHQCVLDANGIMVADCAIFEQSRSDDVCAAHARAIALLPELLAFVAEKAKQNPVFAKGHEKQVIADAKALVAKVEGRYHG